MNNKQIDQMVEKTISFYIVIYKIDVGLSSTPLRSARGGARGVLGFFQWSADHM
jgi:hypothetical protein